LKVPEKKFKKEVKIEIETSLAHAIPNQYTKDPAAEPTM
jgi:hypothetical protein